MPMSNAKTAASPVLFGGAPLPEWAKNSPVLERLNAISADQVRLRAAVAEQRERSAALESEIAALEAERIELLADAALLGPGELGARPAAAEDLARRIEQKRGALNDARILADKLQARASVYEDELTVLRRQYQTELGQLLDAMFAAVAAEYMQAAPAVAALMRQMAAIQEAMMHFQTGNSNGWDRSGRLPAVVPGELRELSPIIDCAAGGLAAQVQDLVEEVKNSLGRAGYRWRF
jgi:septal ring factor EnvC (AmiA/AmiB activator)